MKARWRIYVCPDCGRVEGQEGFDYEPAEEAWGCEACDNFPVQAREVTAISLEGVESARATFGRRAKRWQQRADWEAEHGGKASNPLYRNATAAARHWKQAWKALDELLEPAPPKKRCPIHGPTEQHGIYCNHPMGTRLSCGEPLLIDSAHPEACRCEDCRSTPRVVKEQG